MFKLDNLNLIPRTHKKLNVVTYIPNPSTPTAKWKAEQENWLEGLRISQHGSFRAEETAEKILPEQGGMIKITPKSCSLISTHAH